LRGGQARPCRRVVLSGNTRPGTKPRRAHTHGVDRGETPRATNTSCVTESLLARVEGLEATLTPRPLIPSVPLRPSENPPQTPSKDPRKTLLRHPQRTIGKPSPQDPGGQSQRRTVEASNTALSRGGRRVLRDTLAAPRTVDLRPGTWRTLNLLVSGLHPLVQGVDSDPLRAVFSHSTYPILLVHPYPWPMRTVAQTGLTQTALAAAARQRSLCRRRRPTPSGRSPTRGSSSMRRVSLLADVENFLGRRTR